MNEAIMNTMMAVKNIVCESIRIPGIDGVG